MARNLQSEDECTFANWYLLRQSVSYLRFYGTVEGMKVVKDDIIHYREAIDNTSVRKYEKEFLNTVLNALEKFCDDVVSRRAK